MEEEFKGMDLGDKRLDKRAERLTTKLSLSFFGL